MFQNIYIYIYILYLAAVGLTPGGSGTAYIYTNSTPNTKNGTYITITKLNTHNNKNLTNL